MMSLWDALRMNMMISYQELVRTFLKQLGNFIAVNIDHDNRKAGRLRKILRDFINEF
nr:hypothetical protein [Escherichia coli]